MDGPLDGVRVLEFSEIIAAPFAGMVLSDMGADVIKVEPPWGEAWRLIRQFIPLESRTFMAVNRGKRSLPLDLSRPEGLEVVHKLLPETDVAIVNYRPGVPYKLRHRLRGPVHEKPSPHLLREYRLRDQRPGEPSPRL